MQDGRQARIHFGTIQRPAIGRFQRGTTIVTACVAPAPGLAIVVGALTVGHDPSVAVIGIAFLAVGLVIAQAMFTAVDDVLVVDGRVKWHGLWLSGEAALSALQSVRPAPWPKSALRFDFGRARFDMRPARGTKPFLEELRRVKPDVVVDYPRSLQRLEFMQRWRLHVGSDETPKPDSI